MTIKLNNLSKWRELPADKSLVLRGDFGLRKIDLHLNTEALTSFVALEGGVEYFLGVVDGQETIQFSAEGEVEVSATGDGMVWYWTDDGDDHSHELGEHRLFVKPMTREQRSPQMDALALKMEERANRRFALQEANNERLMAQLRQERAERDAEREAAAAAAAQELVDAAARAGEPEPGGSGVAASA